MTPKEKTLLLLALAAVLTGAVVRMARKGLTAPLPPPPSGAYVAPSPARSG